MKKLLLTTFILLATVNLCRASLFGDTNRIRRDIFNLFTAATATPIKPAEPTTPTEVTNDGWRFDQKRNVWWRLAPANQLPPANSTTQFNPAILPSPVLPNGVIRGMFTLPSRSIQNCGPSG